MKVYRIGLFIGLVVTHLLFFTGCEKKEEIIMGRYIEQDIALSDKKLNKVIPFINNEGKQQMMTFTEGEMQCLALQDDMTIKKWIKEIFGNK